MGCNTSQELKAKEAKAEDEGGVIETTKSITDTAAAPATTPTKTPLENGEAQAVNGIAKNGDVEPSEKGEGGDDGGRNVVNGGNTDDGVENMNGDSGGDKVLVSEAASIETDTKAIVVQHKKSHSKTNSIIINGDATTANIKHVVKDAVSIAAAATVPITKPLPTPTTSSTPTPSQSQLPSPSPSSSLSPTSTKQNGDDTTNTTTSTVATNGKMLNGVATHNGDNVQVDVANEDANVTDNSAGNGADAGVVNGAFVGAAYVVEARKSDQTEINEFNESELGESEDLAATKIQAAFRGHQVRTSMRKSEVKAPPQTTTTSEVDDAAAGAPPELTQAELEAEFDPNDKELCDAALKIQATFRGHLSRKTHNKDTADDVDIQEITKKVAEELDIDLTDPELHKAATKIQASFRGHKTRKEVGGD